MLLDWFHRKFVEILLDFPKGIHYNAEVDGRAKNDMDPTQAVMFSSIAKGHRYRYYIPQVNTREELTNPTNAETNSKAVEITNDKCKDENDHGNITGDLKKSANHKIRKLFVVPMGRERSIEQIRIVKNGIIKEIYPMVRRFYVLPVLDRHEDIRGNKQIEFDSKCDCTQEDEDSNLLISDIFDDVPETPFEDVVSPRDTLIKTPFMEYDYTEVPRENTKLDVGENIGDKVDFAAEIPKKQGDLFYSECEGWWSIYDHDYPISHKKLESRLMDFPKAQKKQKTFMSVLKNLFVREN